MSNKLTAPVSNLVLKIAPTGDVTQWFGVNYELYKQFGLMGHNGIDIARPWGEPMYAIEAGTVVEVKFEAGGFGKHVRYISDRKNKNGYYHEWTYGHCSSISVNVGDKVKKGQEIAKMGNTGFVVAGNTPYWKTNPYAGTHLHLGLREMIKPSRGGWTYPLSTMVLDVVNYSNGFKGAIDPVPTLLSLGVDEKVPDPTPVDVQREKLQLSLIGALSEWLKLLTKK
jgi:murein DD-endopeptidase MepM/ murein hydrolase activator NlpD